MRFIDVENECLIERSDSLRYVALSYVWGNANQVKLKIATKEDFLKKNSLSTVVLPRTIKDVMTLASRLGERYLWIDALCIIQDDEVDKHDKIARMSEIYANAVVTIVASIGKDADAGLPRVNHEPQVGVSTINTTDQSKSDSWIEVHDSVWASRAWTYQETILSKRLLFVLEDRMYFSCEHLLFQEGLAKPEEPVVHPRLESFKHKIERRTALEMYEHAVNSYSAMNLSCEEDVLPAFDGILSKLRSYFRSGYSFGLPNTELESALAWRNGPVESDWTRGSNVTKTSSLPHFRDMTKPYYPLRRRKQLGTEYHINPAWSWAGWVGEVHYNYNLWPVIGMVIDWVVVDDSEASRSSGDPPSWALMSTTYLRGASQDWFWHHGIHNPGYFTDSVDANLRLSNPTAPESEREQVVHHMPGSDLLCFTAHCASLRLVATEDLDDTHGQRSCQAARVPSTMKCLHILDEGHFHAGMIDACQLPTLPKNEKYANDQKIWPAHFDSPLPFVTVLTKEANNQNGLQLVILSRFVGFANTVEPPHRYVSPAEHPQLNESTPPILDNIREPLSPPLPDRDPDDEEDNDPIFQTYDPRRFEKNKFYPFYSVLLVEWEDGVARRLGSGQIHADAFFQLEPFLQTVVLG